MIKKTIVTLAIILLAGFSNSIAVAQSSLQILQLSVETTPSTATITWSTSTPSRGSVDYGLTTTYTVTATSLAPQDTYHQVKISNLKPDQLYHFRVHAENAEQSSVSFDQTFKTIKGKVDFDAPIITGVSIAYVTGTTATIQWKTDENASTGIHLGTTTTYTTTTGGAGDTKIHDFTFGGLTPDTYYHFQIVSADSDGNVATYADQIFHTAPTKDGETMLLRILDYRPLSATDDYIGADYATIEWQTNKLSSGLIRYGTDANALYSSVTIDGFRSFVHKTTINNLKPATQYFYQLDSYDVFGNLVRSEVQSFTTRGKPEIHSIATPVKYTPIVPPTVHVLGYTTQNEETRAEALVRVKGSNDIYAILHGMKWKLSDSVSLNRYSRDVSTITTIPLSQLNRYPQIKLIKSPTDSTVYFLSYQPNGKIVKLALPSSAVFSSYPANSYAKVVVMSPHEITSKPDTTLVKAKGSSTVYLIQNNAKRVIKSAALFERMHLHWNEIVTINTTHLASLRAGIPVE